MWLSEKGSAEREKKRERNKKKKKKLSALVLVSEKGSAMRGLLISKGPRTLTQ